MLDVVNPFAKAFRMENQMFRDNNQEKLQLRLIKKRNHDGRTYNLPTTSEVAALVVGDIDINVGNRDIIVQQQNGLLQRISELHPSYLPMHYPLIFTFGEDGYRDDIPVPMSSDRKSKTDSAGILCI